MRDAGDAVELAARYAATGADELVFLDITATNEKRGTLIELVEQVAATINIPFTVGGGINELRDIEILLASGADKISINTAAVKKPNLIEQAAKNFGSQCVVVAIDANLVDENWFVFLNGGRVATEINAIEWAKTVEDLGAGEILLTSMRHDGTKNGFAVETNRANFGKRQNPDLSHRAAREQSNISPKFSPTAKPTPHWPPAFFIFKASKFQRSNGICANDK